MSRATRTSMFLVVLMYAIFGAEYPIAKVALDNYTNGLTLETTRMLLGGLVFLLYSVFYGYRFTLIERSDWWQFAQLAIFYMCFSYLSSGWALQYMSSLKANILSASAPFVSSIFAYVILRDKLTRSKVLGMLCGVGGLIVVICAAEPMSLPSSDFTRLSLPEIMMFVSILSTEYGYFIVRGLYDKGYTFSIINGIGMLLGGLVTLLIGLTSPIVLGGEPIFQYTSLLPVIGYAAVLLLFVNVVDGSLYGHLMQRYSVTFLTCASCLTPLFGVIYGTILMQESLSVLHLISFFLILLGLYLFSRDDVAFVPRLPH